MVSRHENGTLTRRSKSTGRRAELVLNQKKVLVGAFSVITNLRMDLFEALRQHSGRRASLIKSLVLEMILRKGTKKTIKVNQYRCWVQMQKRLKYLNLFECTFYS